MTTFEVTETARGELALLTVTEAASELRIGRSLAYELARRYLNPAEQSLAGELADLIEAKRNLDLQHAGQRLLKLWLFGHIPLTYGMLVLTAAHVWLALHYSHRL